MLAEIGQKSPETAKLLPENEEIGLNFTETELTLGLPGVQRSSTQTDSAGTAAGKSTVKRCFSQTVDLNLRSSRLDTATHKCVDQATNLPENQVSGAGKPPSPKAQVVGWPPVRSFRMKASKSCKYVKVAVDGAPYLRKVDLETYNSYQQLLGALEEMFSCFTIRHYLNESKLMDPVNGTEYVPTYEDKDGDWMLVGDVPWKMFVESCKRLRLMKSSEAIGLAPRTPEKCNSTK